MLKIEEKDESQRNGCARNKTVSGMVQNHQVNLDLFIVFLYTAFGKTLNLCNIRTRNGYDCFAFVTIVMSVVGFCGGFFSF